jgi:hypothetical protein
LSPIAVKRTSTSLARAGSGSCFHCALIIQARVTWVGGSQVSTRPQSHSLPSTPISYQRPPSRGSITDVSMSASPMWCSGGFQLW